MAALGRSPHVLLFDSFPPSCDPWKTGKLLTHRTLVRRRVAVLHKDPVHHHDQPWSGCDAARHRYTLCVPFVSVQETSHLEPAVRGMPERADYRSTTRLKPVLSSRYDADQGSPKGVYCKISQIPYPISQRPVGHATIQEYITRENSSCPTRLRSARTPRTRSTRPKSRWRET